MKIRLLFLFIIITLSFNAFLFADYNMDTAYEDITDLTDEAFYEEITFFEDIEEQPGANPNKLDINGLLPSDYDINGWARLADGKWVASPAGAKYKGQEEKNLSFLISSVIYEMSDEEKGILKAFLLHGKDLEKNLAIPWIRLINWPSTEKMLL